MHIVGVFLIYAAVLVRGLVRMKDMQHPGQVAALLALYGVLLAVETGLIPWRPDRPAGPRPAAGAAGQSRGRRLLAACLLVQSGLVTGLLLNREVQDFFALLFIPLSLQVVLFFGRRAGFACISALTLAMAGPLLASEEGWGFGLAMVINYGGLCFLLGGYAHQVRMAETTRLQNRQVLGELRAAHRRLQGYAAQVEELAAEQERYRLARELHDSVTQTVFGMNLTVQSARLLLDKEPGVAGQLLRLEELASGAMGEIQTLVSRLRSTPAAEESLPAALRRLAVERQLRDGLQVTLEVEGERPLPGAVIAGLYRIVQEALTNVAKHAGTREVTVRLDLGGEPGCVEVEDQGRGFDPQADQGRQGHLGLTSMAERAREIGWRLSVESTPGSGTRLRVEESPPGGEA
jgi:signal transduction histidine kinase